MCADILALTRSCCHQREQSSQCSQLVHFAPHCQPLWYRWLSIARTSSRGKTDGCEVSSSSLMAGGASDRKMPWYTPRLVVKKRGVRTKVVQQVGGQDSVHRVSGKLFAFGLSGPLPLSFSSQFSALIEPQHVSLVGDMDANTGSRR